MSSLKLHEIPFALVPREVPFFVCHTPAGLGRHAPNFGSAASAVNLPHALHADRILLVPLAELPPCVERLSRTGVLKVV